MSMVMRLFETISSIWVVVVNVVMTVVMIVRLILLLMMYTVFLPISRIAHVVRYRLNSTYGAIYGCYDATVTT